MLRHRAAGTRLWRWGPRGGVAIAVSWDSSFVQYGCRGSMPRGTRRYWAWAIRKSSSTALSAVGRGRLGWGWGAEKIETPGEGGGGNGAGQHHRQVVERHAGEDQLAQPAGTD